MAKKLYAITLGGRATGCNTELHDVVFAVADGLKDCYPQLLAKWFGAPQGLHIDSWIELTVVDGYRVSLEPAHAAAPDNGGMKLFFINLGAYQAGQFGELHANVFLVAPRVGAARARAKAELFPPGATEGHTDTMYDVDDCIEIADSDGFRIRLTQTGAAATTAPHNRYQPLPKAIVDAYIQEKQGKGG